MFVLRLGEQTYEDEIEHQEGHHTDIGRQHRARGGGEREEHRAHHQQRRHRHQEIGVQVILRPERAQLHRIEPWHEAPDQDAERHAGEGDHAGNKGAAKASEQIVELAHRRRADDGAKARFVVAHHDIGHKRRENEDREHAHDAELLHDRIRRIDVHVAGRADLDIGDHCGAERQQEEDAEGDPEHGRAELIAQLERGDFTKHLRRPGGSWGAK